jgi:hypothetical protein
VKRYEVIATPEAEEGIVGAFEYINDRSPENSAKWLRGLYDRSILWRWRLSIALSPERMNISRDHFAS